MLGIAELTAEKTRLNNEENDSVVREILTRRRAIVLTLELYILLLLPVGLHITGDPLNGFYWPSSGFSLFPIPIGNGPEPAFMPLSSIDAVITVMFLWNGLWILWLIVGTSYITLPVIKKYYERIR